VNVELYTRELTMAIIVICRSLFLYNGKDQGTKGH